MASSLKRVEDVVAPQFKNIFPYATFNIVQSRSLEAYREDINMVVGAPTGSGKTVVFELAICRLVASRANRNDRMGKVVYLAPIRALCHERALDWSLKFKGFGLVVSEVTGDDIIVSEKDLGQMDIICTTPEKWDSITRRGSHSEGSSQNVSSKYGVAAEVSLLLVDEVHLLHEKRGPTLEVVVTRMKLIRTSLAGISLSRHETVPAAMLRIIAASATVPNVFDVASWIQAPKQGVKEFGEEARPVQLDTRVLGYEEKNPWIFDNFLSHRLSEVIRRHSNSKPCLIFCPTKKSTMSTASYIAKEIASGNGKIRLGGLLPAEAIQLEEAARRIHDKSLANSLLQGVAFHNGDLSREDKNLVEDLFRKSILRLICTTTTLAQGVNLPAHLVIIKSTKLYISGGLREYEPSTVMQMIGRAGRPQFGDTGVAVIMTANSTVTLYQNVLRGASETIESQLKDKLAEHINAEACRKTIVDFPGLTLWLRSTFLWIRMRRNPERYEVGSRVTSFQEREDTLNVYGVNVVNEMTSAKLLEMEDDESFSSTELAAIMMRLQISFETMKQFLKNLSELHGEQTILRAISQSKEISDEFVLRRSDKRILNDLSKFVRYPVTGKVADVDDKAFILIQSCLEDKGRVSDDPSLRADAMRVIPIATRLSRCISDILTSSLMRASLTRITSGFKVARSIEKRTWWNGDNILKQIPGIGPAFCLQLSLNGINSFPLFRDAGPRKLEAILKKNPPFGNELESAARFIPYSDISSVDCRLFGDQVTIDFVGIVRSLTSSEKGHEDQESQTRKKSYEWYSICIEVGGSPNPPFFHRHRVLVSSTKAVVQVHHSFSLKENRKAFTVRALFAADRFVGADTAKTIPFRITKDGTLSPMTELCPERASGVVPKLKVEKEGLGGKSRGCKHKCADKRVCKHLCCKSGLLYHLCGARAELLSIELLSTRLDLLVRARFGRGKESIAREDHRKAGPEHIAVETGTFYAAMYELNRLLKCLIWQVAAGYTFPAQAQDTMGLRPAFRSDRSQGSDDRQASLDKLADITPGIDEDKHEYLSSQKSARLTQANKPPTRNVADLCLSKFGSSRGNSSILGQKRPRAYNKESLVSGGHVTLSESKVAFSGTSKRLVDQKTFASSVASSLPSRERPYTSEDVINCPILPKIPKTKISLESQELDGYDKILDDLF